MAPLTTPGLARRPLWLTPLVALAIALLTPSSALGQLTAADIAELQKQGEEQGWTFTVGENSATRYSLDQLCGVVKPKDWWVNARFDPCTPRGDSPEYFDWCALGACTPIKHQGSCGSCWAFALVGSVESNIFIKDSVIEDLSEQWLVSCCGLGGCSGEWPGNAANFYLCSGEYQDYCGDWGAVLEEDFPYVAWEAPCECPYPHPYCLETWAFIGPEWGIPTNDQLKQAILDHGPVTVCVYVNSAFGAYTGGIFNACEDKPINHAVVLVGWDDNQGPNGVWFLRNSWGSGWGENGYMRIEYECSRIGYNGLYVDYAGATPSLKFEYPDGRPDLLTPGQPTTFRVDVSGVNDGEPVPDTGQLHYSLNGADYVTEEMAESEPNHYEATLPAADCFDRFNWYVSAEEATVGRLYDPKNAPATTYSSIVATDVVLLFEDDFESDQGWTVYAGADTGNWERADPEQVSSGGVITQPGDDHSPDGTLCYVTGPLAGSSAGSYDVDGGPTHLTSPVFDLEETDGTVSYWRWYHISTEWDDELVVAVSNDNGNSWTTVETVTNRQEWTYAEWRVGDYVTPTAQVRVRFTADDTPNNSLVESLVDDFKIESLECTPPFNKGDLNCDGEVNFNDVNPFVVALTDPSGYAAWFPDCDIKLADINGDGEVDFGDINPFVELIGGPQPEGRCQGVEKGDWLGADRREPPRRSRTGEAPVPFFNQREGLRQVRVIIGRALAEADRLDPTAAGHAFAYCLIASQVLFCVRLKE